MKKILLMAVFIAAFTPSVFCQRDDFSVEIEPKNTLASKSDQYFSVFTRVVNASGKDQTIYMWSCSYEGSWKVDNPLVVLSGVICVENHLFPKLIKQGDKLEENVSLAISKQAKPGDITFKLGFRVCKNENDFGTDKEEMYWSNPVTIRIQSASLLAPK